MRSYFEVLALFCDVFVRVSVCAYMCHCMYSPLYSHLARVYCFALHSHMETSGRVSVVSADDRDTPLENSSAMKPLVHPLSTRDRPLQYDGAITSAALDSGADVPAEVDGAIARRGSAKAPAAQPREDGDDDDGHGDGYREPHSTPVSPQQRVRAQQKQRRQAQQHQLAQQQQQRQLAKELQQQRQQQQQQQHEAEQEEKAAAGMASDDFFSP